MTAPLWILTFRRIESTHLTRILNDISTNGNHIFQPAIQEYHKPEIPLNCKLYYSDAKELTPETIEQHVRDVRFVILIRDDPVAQATSAYLDKHVQLPDNPSEDDLARFKQATIPLDVQTLMKLYSRSFNQTAKLWRTWLGGRPHRLYTHKQVTEAPKPVVTDVLRHIGYTGPIDKDPEVAPRRPEHPCNKQLDGVLWRLIHAGKLPKPPPAQTFL